jgi:hypothetical protein
MNRKGMTVGAVLVLLALVIIALAAAYPVYCHQTIPRAWAAYKAQKAEKARQEAWDAHSTQYKKIVALRRQNSEQVLDWDSDIADGKLALFANRAAYMFSGPGLGRSKVDISAYTEWHEIVRMFECYDQWDLLEQLGFQNDRPWKASELSEVLRDLRDAPLDERFMGHHGRGGHRIILRNTLPVDVKNNFIVGQLGFCMPDATDQDVAMIANAAYTVAATRYVVERFVKNGGCAGGFAQLDRKILDKYFPECVEQFRPEKPSTGLRTLSLDDLEYEKDQARKQVIALKQEVKLLEQNPAAYADRRAEWEGSSSSSFHILSMSSSGSSRGSGVLHGYDQSQVRSAGELIEADQKEIAQLESTIAKLKSHETLNDARRIGENKYNIELGKYKDWMPQFNKRIVHAKAYLYSLAS